MSWSAPRTGGRRRSSQTGHDVQQIGPSDYRGNMAGGMVLPDANGTCPTQDPTNPYCLNYDNGVTYQNSTVNMADITDGTTNTLLIGETLTGELVAGDELLRPDQHRPDHQQADRRPAA